MAGVYPKPLILSEQAGTPTTPPANNVAIYPKADGKMYRLDDAGVESQLGGPSWPVGSVIQHAGTVAPTGWMMCIQDILSQTGFLLKAEYPELYDAIGLAYTPYSAQLLMPDHFGLPHMAGAVAVGASSSMVPGDSGGSPTVSLSVSNMPSHTHSNGTLTAASAGAHVHNPPGSATHYIFAHTAGNRGHVTGGASMQAAAMVSAGAHTHDVTGNTSAAGSGSSFSVMQPYVVLNYIIRVVP